MGPGPWDTAHGTRWPVRIWLAAPNFLRIDSMRRFCFPGKTGDLIRFSIVRSEGSHGPRPMGHGPWDTVASSNLASSSKFSPYLV